MSLKGFVIHREELFNKAGHHQALTAQLFRRLTHLGGKLFRESLTDKAVHRERNLLTGNVAERASHRTDRGRQQQIDIAHQHVL